MSSSPNRADVSVWSAAGTPLGPLPRQIYLVGCEPQVVDEWTMELSPAVSSAVDRAVHEVERLL